MKALIDKLEAEHTLSAQEFVQLIKEISPGGLEYLFSRARTTTLDIFGDGIYTRGLIEFTSYCRCNCLYCGLRNANAWAERYRLTHDEILECCDKGYELGFRTFVLQGGEDPFFSDGDIVRLISAIKDNWPTCAVTLSIGEKSREAYQSYFNAGADRYLLRHETADFKHYAALHPAAQTPQNRRRCLRDLKEIGYQVGTGFMVGSPWQTPELLVEDLLYIRDLRPQMIGIGPFLPHHQTPLRDYPAGTLDQTVLLVAVLRLMLPLALIPATTALATLSQDGRERAVLAGANVVMPNLSPRDVRKKYMIYDNKVSTGVEAAEAWEQLSVKMAKLGRRLLVDKGDYKDESK